MEHRDFTLDVLESAISGYSRTLSDQTKERRRSTVLIPIYCRLKKGILFDQKICNDETPHP